MRVSGILGGGSFLVIPILPWYGSRIIKQGYRGRKDLRQATEFLLSKEVWENAWILYILEMEVGVSWEYVRDPEDPLSQDQKKLFSNIGSFMHSHSLWQSKSHDRTQVGGGVGVGAGIFFAFLVGGIVASQWKGMDSGETQIWSYWYNLPGKWGEGHD